MNILKCIIVDDEPPAIRLLQKYIDKISFLELVASTHNPLEALQIIEKQEVDLIFLDIQMPELSGIQLSKIIKDKTNIIFTTAYPQFALESYELNAVDYLLKPFDFERFYQAVSKVKPGEELSLHNLEQNVLFVKTTGKNNFEKINLTEIQFIESIKNYVAIHLENKEIITYNTLKNIREQLPKSHFIQVHKSYIVAIDKINKTDSIYVVINDKEIPIGNSYKSDFFEIINKNKL